MAFAAPLTPLVTIGIPTRNRPDGLRLALEQATRQTYRNLEIIVSDNASDDPRNLGVAREFQAKDHRVRVIAQEHNIGIDANFKTLLSEARGEFFCWAADDDERSLDFVELCVSHIGTCGSIMTGMQLAVRPRGLLRPKPPLHLSPERGPYANAVTFFNNVQPSLFYGLHRTSTLRIYLQEFLHDYYDYFFILRQILTHGFKTIPQVAFTIGVDSEAPAYKAARPRPGSLFEYWPFYSKSLRAIWGSRVLTASEKARLALLTSFVGLNEFSFFEKSLQPRRTRCARGAMELLRAAGRLARVPLPPPPPTMVLPTDPDLIPLMFHPPEDLESQERLREHLTAARILDRNIRVAIAHLEAQKKQSRFLTLPIRALRYASRRLVMAPSRPASPPTLAVPKDTRPMPISLADLRRELGQTMLSIEKNNPVYLRLKQRFERTACAA